MDLSLLAHYKHSITIVHISNFLPSHHLFIITRIATSPRGIWAGEKKEKHMWVSFSCKNFNISCAMDAMMLVIVSLSKQNYFNANIFLYRKILSHDLVTAHIRLKSSKNVESELVVPIKSRGMVVSWVWTVDLWLEGACQGLGNHYQILGLARSDSDTGNNSPPGYWAWVLKVLYKVFLHFIHFIIIWFIVYKWWGNKMFNKEYL